MRFQHRWYKAGALAGACILMAACARKEAVAGRGTDGQQRQAVEVMAVERRDIVDSLNLVGSLAPNESARIRAEIAGQVRAIYFQEGQRVEKDQVLLKIDDAELRAQLAQAEARFRLAELNLQRAENLRHSQTNTQADYDRASSEFAGGKAELALLRTRIEKTEIKAPFAGVVAARTVSPGDYVTAASDITTINDLSRLKVEFQVPERYLSQLRPGATFNLQAQASAADKPVPGTVYFVNAVIDRDTRSSEIKGFLDNPPPNLKAGMFGNVELVLDTHRGALTVPEGAILMSQEGTQVIAVRAQGADQVAEFVPVQLGLRAHGFVEVSPVKGELPEGQLVVASGVGGLVLYPGMKLEPQPLRAEFRVGDRR